MATNVKPIPDGYHALTPHITVNGAERAIDFYQKAFGAKVSPVMKTTDGRVMHAEVRIGDSVLMLNDPFPEHGGSRAATGDPGPITIHLYVDRVDDVFQKAVKNGAAEKMPLMDMFWGDRYGQVVDPFGIRWSLATHIKDVSPQEMEQAQKEMAKQMEQQRKTA
jgi:uncharacterized glyoxalase superfamily protein PhnB